MQTFTAPDYLTLMYRSDLHFLVARWQRPVTGAETQEGYRLILSAAQACKCPYWLLDGRRRLPADPETTAWGLHEFFPTLSQHLGSKVYMSQLLSPLYQQLTSASQEFQQAEGFPHQTYKMRRFNDETHAVEWLQQAQREASQA
ncbi:hypothetical protein HMJ29_17285 [Hymenobacter taeanensis]|uniref:STAS/SEC14 domain-containing protein n=1 Tax=Hymenobacter taeanensis TaxID=2735321 RepID=A0A6M6BKE6_9BACT|nr:MULTISPECIES: hypothetical protein [Hymenobacter]QJX48576.1 hypothetical protein HMJ29_17285 [Hymenobacter taeanensis]UOQ81925.1 hypothetical protein MUN83_03810 [Hymenobacter sp. 5414T-23]